VRMRNFAPSCIACDLTLSYILTLTPSELHNSQKNRYFNSKLNQDAPKVGSSLMISNISLSTSFVFYLYYNMGKNPYIMTQKALILSGLNLPTFQFPSARLVFDPTLSLFESAWPNLGGWGRYILVSELLVQHWTCMGQRST
jgi:hypothetical protein